MIRNADAVPFGYEPPAEQRKGTLIYYDSFEHTTDEELDAAAWQIEILSFAKLVLYPLHEETVRRMTKEPVTANYKREDRLHKWKRERVRSDIVIEGFEGKRKRYTPIDSALRYLTEKYKSPYFLYMTPQTANMFASYSSFEEWIVKLRLLLFAEPREVHPRLEKYRHRWKTVGETKAERNESE
ncbi:hypothetical protein KZ483_14480 [Paenibacillus sp. sptzw28]|uniref:hypothetical protein n=1 Tax=Paenibacillus sp. sptzw28 TaxID=715179 RepID=UPI001C6F13D8|nr:hypothetical protein [Paenibacillus sp. sptzw28]QYR19168.1 hypothetical protein KZ483_14480 [Paenibacillus sp. sptzw28]